MAKRTREPSPDSSAQRLLDYQRILGAFARTGSEGLSPQRLMQYATALASGATKIRHVKVLRYRPDRGDLLIEAGVGWKPGVVGEVALSIDMASPPGRALQTGMPVVIEDMQNDPEFIAADVLREHGIVSLVNVPIMFDGRTWGVFEVDADQPRHFDEADIGFLTAFANILGMALQHKENEEAKDRLAAQHSIASERAQVLLEELQHRVKNNFQVILSFLSLQRRNASTKDVKDRFASVIDRVLTIALAHDQLSLSEGGSTVEFGDYLQSLCKNIDPRRENVVLELSTGGLTLPLHVAVPAGLIVNELVTNAYKHAFDKDGGVVRVSFEVHPEVREAVITVEDNGKGIVPPRNGGMGLRLVETFALQLSGHVERDSAAPGTRTQIWFPLP